MSITSLDLRILSELSYLDLDKYYAIAHKGYKQRVLIRDLGNGLLENEFYNFMKQNGSIFNKEDVIRVLSKWELFGSVQTYIKSSKSKVPNNPLFNAFAFRYLDSQIDKIAIIFRGSNPRNEDQWKEDMKVNLTLFFTKQISNERISQLDLASSFVMFIMKNEGFEGCEIIEKDNYRNSEKSYDYTKKVFLTGHSKGGFLVQQVVFLHELIYNIKVQGVTFAATPIEGINILVELLKEKKAVSHNCNIQQFSNINFLLKRDKVLIGLRFRRLYEFYKMLISVNKQIKDPSEQLKWYNFLKVMRIWYPEYIGKKELLKPSVFSLVLLKRPVVYIKKHGLSWFDKLLKNGKLKIH